MDPSKYGPFVNIVALACALVVTFSVLLLKMLGTTKSWTWLSSDSPSFLVTAAPRAIVVALMALTYVTINSSNYVFFGILAVLCGFFGFWAIARFDYLRKLHVLKIPLVGEQGQQLVDARGNMKYENVVIGSEAELLPRAKSDFEAACQQFGSLSLGRFMSGYGHPRVNDPEALWDRKLLAKISNRLTVTLMYIVLFAVMAVFLAAFVIEVASR